MPRNRRWHPSPAHLSDALHNWNERRHRMTKEWDVLVIGAGPAGIAAAVSAAEAGQRVCIVDDNPRPGGQIWRGGAKNAQAAAWQHRLKSASIDRLAGWHVFATPAPYVLRAE